MSTIDEIKQKLDIADVVSEYVSLQKAGRNFKAKCPFHTEKTPSFFVFPERQSWHCFGSCGTGGDMFSCVMKNEGVSFSEALKLLAGKAGVSLSIRRSDKVKDDGAERLFQINEAAARYYHSLLLGAKVGEVSRHHLAKRGISMETIVAFDLGASPDRHDALCQHLIGCGYERGEMLAAGLVIEREDGSIRDLFRNRLMIPIRNEQGRVVGFGARCLDQSTPKYLNSPHTAVFDKSSILFGLDRAKKAIAEQGAVVVVEGYMDVLIAHQYGIANVVASMGTSLTEKQLSIVKKLTKNLVLALDADTAGDEATFRCLEAARQAFSRRVVDAERSFLGGTSRLQATLKVIHLPQGKDPDEVIRENPQGWQKLVEQATPLIEYVLDAITSRLDMSSEQGKATAAEQMLPILLEMDDAVERELYLKKVSRLTGVDERTLAGKAARLKPTRKERANKMISLPSIPTRRYPLEEYCMSLLLQHPELGVKTGELSPECFEGIENREIYLAWRDCCDVRLLRQSLDASLWEHLDFLHQRAMPPTSVKELEAAYSDSARRLSELRLKKLKALEETLILDAESEGNKEEVHALLEKALKPNIELKTLYLEGKRVRKGSGK